MARQQRQFPQGKYILRSQNGSQNYAVYMYYYWKGKQVRHSIDLYVTPNDWNQDANGGAGEFRPSYGPNYKERNAYLRSLNRFVNSNIFIFFCLCYYTAKVQKSFKTEELFHLIGMNCSV